MYFRPICTQGNVGKARVKIVEGSISEKKKLVRVKIVKSFLALAV